MKLLIVLLYIAIFGPLPTCQHGYLMTPPSRSTAWRYGFDTPPNYTDNELNCGGFTRQWQQNGGKCGECGDAYDTPVGQRPNQAGGTYATGTIVGHYTAGEIIDVVVKVTANHMGWFEFRLCEVNNKDTAVTWDCLNQTLLELEDGSTRHYIPHDPMDITTRVKLPADVTCSQCVLQWMWHCGNNWGRDPDGTECIGCGPQEQFYGCADITITGGNGGQTTTDQPSTTTANSGSSTTEDISTTTTTSAPDTTTTSSAPESTTTSGAPESTSSSAPDTTTSGSGGQSQCRFVGPSDDDEINDWCTSNCNHVPCYCPTDCVCDPPIDC